MDAYQLVIKYFSKLEINLETWTILINSHIWPPIFYQERNEAFNLPKNTRQGRDNGPIMKPRQGEAAEKDDTGVFKMLTEEINQGIPNKATVWAVLTNDFLFDYLVILIIILQA